MQDFSKENFKDSKVLTEKRREIAYTEIQKRESLGELMFASGRASNKEIDTYGIVLSLQLAVTRGIFILFQKYFIQHLSDQLLHSNHGEDIMAHTLFSKLLQKSPTRRKPGGKMGRYIVSELLHLTNSKQTFTHLIIDGNNDFGLRKSLDVPVITIIKGDSKQPLISLSSIIAKVERDRYMKKIDTQKIFQAYNFKQHKGYGTKRHRAAIAQYGISVFHRATFCHNIKVIKQNLEEKKQNKTIKFPAPNTIKKTQKNGDFKKPSLLLHICCAPDLTWPLHRLKEHFKLYLFWYNPNIHPRKEHGKRYEQFMKLIGFEKGDYEILEDWYDPKEFFDAMIDKKESIDKNLRNSSDKEVLKKAATMVERSSRCNPCYSSRLEQAAKMAQSQNIPYFTSTLLISPKKKMDKLYNRGKEAEKTYPKTKFLRFDFIKNNGYIKASQLTKKHKLRRQNYCGCGWTIPKPGERKNIYTGG